jgi:hypothetical protein
MAKHSLPNLFPDEAAKQSWADTILKKFNDARGTNVKSIDELQHVKGGPGFLSEEALNYVSAPRQAKRLTKGRGKRDTFTPPNWNEKAPKALQNTKWIGDPPEGFELTNEGYLRALKDQSVTAKMHGQNLFSHQWYVWDKMRQRLEPHEVLFPGLEKLPRMSMEELRDARAAHAATGYMEPIGESYPMRGGPASGAYWSVPLAGGYTINDLLGKEN